MGWREQRVVQKLVTEPETVRIEAGYVMCKAR
jgi:hypothetical protein